MAGQSKWQILWHCPPAAHTSPTPGWTQWHCRLQAFQVPWLTCRWISSTTGRPASQKHAPPLWSLHFGSLRQPISKEGIGHRELGSTMGWIRRAWNQNTTNFLNQSPWQEFLPRKLPLFYLNNCSRRDPKRRPGIHSFQFHINREWMCTNHLFVLKCKHQEGIRT